MNEILQIKTIHKSRKHSLSVEKHTNFTGSYVLGNSLGGFFIVDSGRSNILNKEMGCLILRILEILLTVDMTIVTVCNYECIHLASSSTWWSLEVEVMLRREIYSDFSLCVI